MKRLILVLLLMLGLSLTATAQDSIKIGLSLPTLTEEFHVLLQESAQAAAEEADAELVLPAADAEGDIEAELANVQELIDAGVNILLLYPVDASASAPAVQAATDAEIPVILLDRDVVRPEDSELNIVSLVTADWEAAGAEASDFLCSELDGEGVVIALQGAGLTGEETDLTTLPAYNVVTSAVAGIETYFADNCADATLIVEETETFTNADSLTNFATLVDENRPDALIVGDAALTIEAIDAVRAARLRGVLIVSLSRSDDVLGALEAGQLTLTIIPNPEELGAVGVETALAALNGDEAEPTVSVETVRVDSETAEQFRDCMGSCT